MAAIGIVVMAGMVGGGVDISRMYMTQNRLQNACDSGVLAGRRAVSENGYDSFAKSQADSYFHTNFDQDIAGTHATTFITKSTENDNQINGTASTKLNNTVMKLFGFTQSDISVQCTASMSVGNSDIIMVLDTTGSMARNLSGTTRIRALQDAMKGFYNTVEAASSNSNARIRYGFVPYSSSVNVGRVLYDQNPNYLADKTPIQSREAQYEQVQVETLLGWEDPVFSEKTGSVNYSTSSWSRFNGPHRSVYNCRANEPQDSNWVKVATKPDALVTYIDSKGQRVTKTTSSISEQQTEYYCARSYWRWYVLSRVHTRLTANFKYKIEKPIKTYKTIDRFVGFRYKQVDYDTSRFKAFETVTTITGNGGTKQSSSWGGCIQERATVSEPTFGWSSLLGITPSGALDLDIDMIPDPNNPDTQWKPMWPQVAYYRYPNRAESDYGAASTEEYCPNAAQLLTTMDKGDFYDYAESLTPSGWTYHDIGMIWGARLASPSGIFKDNVTDTPENGGAVARHIIFMTDGSMWPNIRQKSAYGIEMNDRRVTDNGSFYEQRSRHTSRFLAVCAAAKAKGLRVWVIAFASNLTSDLVTCASDDSSFMARDATQLNDAFQQIAKDVGELRVVA